MKNTDHSRLFDMVILGGGPAGFTAALYAVRAGLYAVVLEKLSPGGQMALSHKIDNYPGFEDGIDGFTLAQKMEDQALRFGAVSELADIQSVDLHANPKVIKTSEGVFYGKTVVIATGAVPRTLDLPEEAALTAEALGNEVLRLYDVGVAGLHRLLAHLDEIMSASVIIAIAGMEGALASVIGGLADCPVIAVPTSVGYGASFQGLSALLSMLNSCASGVSVVNIDNGFGAGYLASMINHMEVK